MVVLGDLYNRNEKLPLAALKGSRVPGTLRASMTIQCVCEKLCEKAAFHYPHTFSRARVMVKKAGNDVTKCLMVGMLEQKLRFFPAFKMRSIRNNGKVSWCGKGCWEIHNDMEMPSNEKHGMPWLSRVLGRL
ncbi:MAG: hypothetical protein ACRCZO_14660, partial [Cetobacterium sp.]